MKLRILVDAISLLSPVTGIGRYTYEVSKFLTIKNDLEVSFFYGYHSSKLLAPSEKSDVKNLKSVIVKNKHIKKIAREILLFSSKVFSKQYDIYWQPNFIPNNVIKAKKVITSVHDFSFILHKEFHPKERIEYFEKYFLKNIIKSDIIITGSEFSKKEILEKLNFKNDQVKVIYHGIDHALFKVYNEVSINFVLPKKFIFSVGSIEPRKNLLGLLNAYILLNENIKKEYKLVLAGFKGWENKEILEIVKDNHVDIQYLGYLTDEELAKTYNLASLFLFPSFYEGFGLPVLEAMACGTPVITSSLSSLPEVGGDAVVYCDPYNINDIKEKIEFVINDESLQKVMLLKGLEQAKKFTWKKSAEQHIKVFKKVLES